MKKSELKKLDSIDPANLTGYLAINAEANKSFVICSNVDNEIIGISVEALKDNKLFLTSCYEKISDLIIDELIINKDDFLVPSDPDNPKLDELDQKQEDELKKIVCISRDTVSELYKAFEQLTE